ncbi:MAG: UbiD family decarboxylase [Saprospiraceae bacterium]|nr:UbiD family decarboxylase [Candidatus Vicinibacter affinis]
MSYPNLVSCLNDLEKTGQLLRIPVEVDPDQEMAEIHRRIYDKGGPAILFEKVKSSPFMAASNLYGTNERSEFIFRSSLVKMEQLIRLKVNPAELLKSPFKSIRLLPFLTNALPKKVIFNKPVLQHQTKISQLPLIKSWPDDGGAFITLPQVISFPPESKSLKDANVGMYRIQLTGNQYLPEEEVGLHYQLHRGIGIHHKAYNQTTKEFKISIGVGGPPAYSLGSIFPLPEGMSEILFSGLLGNKRYPYTWHEGYFIPVEVDFCITGTVLKDQLKPEGPFGDHLGYYSLTHDFPVLKVHKIFHKTDPIWHFTVVGRPPQEDSGFGHLIHQMVKELTTNEFPGVKEIHAVDVAGVHPLLLAIGSERYMPFREKSPEEILTQANHILGKGQTSLAKYLFISTNDDAPNLTTKNVPEFFDYFLRRVDWKNDLHFYTKTTIDTLDYSGENWNSGSKLVVACNRNIQRTLSRELGDFPNISTVQKIKLIAPGIIALGVPKYKNAIQTKSEVEAISEGLKHNETNGFPLLILVDDAEFVSSNFSNFLWVTFTRSNPANDIYGVDEFIENKHWGCKGSLIIDARIKPHHAPELIVDKHVQDKVDELFHSVACLKPFA